MSGFPPPLLIKKHTPKQIGQTFLGEHRGGRLILLFARKYNHPFWGSMGGVNWGR